MIVLFLAELEFISPSSHHSAVLSIGSWKGVDNTPVFWLQLRSISTASALSLNIPYSSKGLGKGRVLGGHTAGSADPNPQRDMPLHFCSVIRAKERRRSGEYLLFTMFAFWRTLLCVLKPCLLGSA